MSSLKSQIADKWLPMKLSELVNFIGSGKTRKFSSLGEYPVYGSTGEIARTNQPDYSGNAILIARVGANAGTINLVTGNYGVTDNTIIIRIKSDYLLDYVKLQLEIKKLNSLAFGSGQPLVTGSQLKEVELLLPGTFHEQQSIATALSDADAYIEFLEKLIAKKRAIKKGVMQELLTGKRRLPGFSGEWVDKKIKQFGDIVTGSTPLTGVKEFWNGDIPWVTPTDISNKKDIYASERQITILGLSSIRKLPINSVLITCIASIGKNAILRSEGACNQQINAIVPNKDHDADFLYYLIESRKQYLLGNAGITATMIISKKDFSELDFTVPLLPEQTAIANVLNDIDSDITAHEAKLSKARLIKQGMMQELLTGRIRLI